MAESITEVLIKKKDVEKDFINNFVEITMAEESEAKYYLSKHRWNIIEAVNSYFSSSQTNVSAEEFEMLDDTGTSSNPIVIDDSFNGECLDNSHIVGEHKSTEMNHLKLLTWNIDGLSEGQILERTRFVCELINTRQPDIVFLQEVIDDTSLAFHRRCIGYSTLTAKHTAGYFNAIMLRNQSVKPSGSVGEIHFTQSTMGRHLLIQPVIFNQNAKLVLMTSHLESTTKCVQERKRQLGFVFQKMLMQDPECTVIFGGDTNLRDIEVKQVGIPDGVSDAWEVCGEAEDTKFTWDVSVNDNLDWSFSKKPKLRFDRIYVRPGKSHSSLVPVEFGLVGKQRLASGCFPSDHWGIWCEFKKEAEEKG